VVKIAFPPLILCASPRYPRQPGLPATSLWFRLRPPHLSQNSLLVSPPFLRMTFSLTFAKGLGKALSSQFGPFPHHGICACPRPPPFPHPLSRQVPPSLFSNPPPHAGTAIADPLCCRQTSMSFPSSAVLSFPFLRVVCSVVPAADFFLVFTDAQSQCA